MSSNKSYTLECEGCLIRLVVIAQQHLKLALEYNQPVTSIHRKEIIKLEIELL